MTLGLSTEGFVTGGAGGGTSPSIVVISPTPGVEPGEAGGFPAAYSSAKSTPIIIQIASDASTSLAFVVVTNETDGFATVFRGSNFLGDYIADSETTPITNGTQLTIAPADGWPADSDPTIEASIKLRVDAVDAQGGTTNSSFVWTLPAAQTAVIPSSEPVEGIDHVSLAVDRLAYQFKGNIGT